MDKQNDASKLTGLADDQLDGVAGGWGKKKLPDELKTKVCEKCGHTMYYCNVTNNTIEFFCEGCGAFYSVPVKIL